MITEVIVIGRDVEIDYDVVYGPFLVDLITRVREKQRDGWKTAGGLAVNEHGNYVQAMVLVERSD